VPYGLFADAIPEHTAHSADSAKDFPTIDGSRAKPGGQLHVYPIGYRDSADMTGLANEVHDSPVFLSLLQVFDSQIRGLVSPQSACEEKCQQGTVTFTLHSRGVRTLPQRASLLRCEPVSHPNAIFLQTLHPPNPGGQIGAEQTTICGL
jgi:hypothetical protein